MRPLGPGDTLRSRPCPRTASMRMSPLALIGDLARRRGPPWAEPVPPVAPAERPSSRSSRRRRRRRRARRSTISGPSKLAASASDRSTCVTGPSCRSLRRRPPGTRACGCCGSGTSTSSGRSSASGGRRATRPSTSPSNPRHGPPSLRISNAVGPPLSPTPLPRQARPTIRAGSSSRREPVSRAHSR